MLGVTAYNNFTANDYPIFHSCLHIHTYSLTFTNVQTHTNTLFTHTHSAFMHVHSHTLHIHNMPTHIFYPHSQRGSPW